MESIDTNRPNIRTAMLDWTKGSGLLLVTVLGILLYIILSIPATIFYGRLGTTPSEVGISYSNLLSGSTLGIVVIFIIFIAIFLAISFVAAFVGFTIQMYNFIRHVQGFNVDDILSGRQGWELSDDEFEELIKKYKTVNSYLPPWDELRLQLTKEEPRWRRIRELQKLGVRTAEQYQEIESLADQSDRELAESSDSFLWEVLTATKYWIRRRGAVLLLCFSLATVVIILPGIAYIQAGQVINGKLYTGSQLSFFDYRAESVSVKPASSATAQSVQGLLGKKLFLLGQNSLETVLYSPMDKATIRVPSTTIVITGSP